MPNVQQQLFLYAGRTAGEYNSLGLEVLDLLQGKIERVDFTIYICLAHTAGDELGVLRTEVENEDHFSLFVYSLLVIR